MRRSWGSDLGLNFRLLKIGALREGSPDSFYVRSPLLHRIEGRTHLLPITARLLRQMLNYLFLIRAQNPGFTGLPAPNDSLIQVRFIKLF